MKVLILCLATLISAIPFPNEPVTDEIVGGEPVENVDQFPWMSVLQMRVIGTGSAMCGGSLIAPNAILTAGRKLLV